MRKKRRCSSPSSAGRPYTERQLAGLHTHTQEQKQATVDRLRAAILALETSGQPISARTIQEKCGLEYASIRRNPAALLLYQQHSTFLKQKRKRAKVPNPDAPTRRDPLLAYKKADLVARLRNEQTSQKEWEAQYSTLLQDSVQKDVKIAELEAELAQYRKYLEGLRLTIQQREHGG